MVRSAVNTEPVERVAGRVLAVIALHRERQRRVRRVFRRQHQLHAVGKFARRSELDRLGVGAGVILVGIGQIELR